MPNLTITVDADTLLKARVRAIQRGESVNAMLANVLRRYADTGGATEVFSAIEALADEHSIGSQSGPRSWTRDELQRA